MAGHAAAPSAVIVGPEPMTWLFVGDSITQGVLHTAGARNFVEHCGEAIRWESGRVHDVVVNAGVSGWRVPDLLADFEFRVTRFAPDVVVAMFGTNDATAGTGAVAAFEEQLSELVGRIRATGAQLVLQVPPPLRGEPSGRAGMPGYVAAVRAVARAESVLLVDHDLDWSRNLPDGGLGDGWLADDIHPNAAGHERMARHALEVLGLAR